MRFLGIERKHVPYSLDHLCGGLAGGFCSSLLVHPLDLLRVQFSGAALPLASRFSLFRKLLAVNEGYKQAAAYNRRPRYSGYFDAVRRIVAKGGVRALYQGLAPNMLGYFVAYGVYFQLCVCFAVTFDHFLCFCRYDLFKRSMPVTNDALRDTRNLLSGVLAGPPFVYVLNFVAFLAGALCFTVTNPLCLCRTQQCLHYAGSGTQAPSMMQVLTGIYRAEGLCGLYRVRFWYLFIFERAIFAGLRTWTVQHDVWHFATGDLRCTEATIQCEEESA